MSIEPFVQRGARINILPLTAFSGTLRYSFANINRAQILVIICDVISLQRPLAQAVENSFCYFRSSHVRLLYHKNYFLQYLDVTNPGLPHENLSYIYQICTINFLSFSIINPFFVENKRSFRLMKK